MSDTIISITVNGTALQGILQPSAATASLMAALPLDLPFKDYGGQEKIAALPEPLALEGMPSGGSAPPGTIGYYVPDQALVLYYESVDHYPGIILSAPSTTSRPSAAPPPSPPPSPSKRPWTRSKHPATR